MAEETETKKPDENKPAEKAFTQADIDAAIKAANDAAESRVALAKKAAEDKAAEEEAKRNGQFEKLAADEKSKREGVEKRIVAMETEAKLRDKLSDKHPDYASRFKYIKAVLPENADDKSIDETIEAFVKDNPIAVKGAAGTQPFNGTRQQPKDKPIDPVQSHIDRHYKGPFGGRFANQSSK